MIAKDHIMFPLSTQPMSLLLLHIPRHHRRRRNLFSSSFAIITVITLFRRQDWLQLGKGRRCRRVRGLFSFQSNVLFLLIERHDGIMILLRNLQRKGTNDTNSKKGDNGNDDERQYNCADVNVHAESYIIVVYCVLVSRKPKGISCLMRLQRDK